MTPIHKLSALIFCALLLNPFLAPHSFGADEADEFRKDLGFGIGYLGTFQGSSDSHALALDFSWDAWSANPNFIIVVDVMAGALKATGDKTVMSLGAFLEFELAKAWTNPISFSLIGGIQQWDFNDDLTTYGIGLNYNKQIGPMDQIFFKYLTSELEEGSESITNAQAYFGLATSF